MSSGSTSNSDDLPSVILVGLAWLGALQLEMA
jgi:hypothetical protein